MQIFQADNHEFVFGKVLLFGELLQERGTKQGFKKRFGPRGVNRAYADGKIWPLQQARGLLWLVALPLQQLRREAL